jgi:hypothetical protein
MPTVEEGLKAQVRNIEAKHGRTMAEWGELLAGRGLQRHGEMMPVLKNEFGLSHGNANRVALVVLAERSGPKEAGSDLAGELYAGKKAALRPVHDRLMAAVLDFGNDVEVAPKKGYLSLRRRKQFAMVQPGAGHVDVGLILAAEPAAGRLEAAGNFNAMFSHRVRLASPENVDPELVGWLRTAYEGAG